MELNQHIVIIVVAVGCVSVLTRKDIESIEQESQPPWSNGLGHRSTEPGMRVQFAPGVPNWGFDSSRAYQKTENMMSLLSYLRRHLEFKFEVLGACAGKVRYGHQETAEEAAAKMNKKATTRRRLEAYRCPECAGWHLGGCD